MIGLAVLLQHVGDHPADAAEADDDRAGAFRVELQVGRELLARLDPPRDELADLGEQRA